MKYIQYRSSHRTCFIWKGILRNFAKSTGVFLWICEISKNTFFTEDGRLLLSVEGKLDKLFPKCDTYTFNELFFRNLTNCFWSARFLNPFYPTGLFPYPLKTSEKQRFPHVFRGYRKRPVTWYGLILKVFTKNNTYKLYRRYFPVYPGYLKLLTTQTYS